MAKNPKRAAELAAYFTHAKLQVCTDFKAYRMLSVITKQASSTCQLNTHA